MRRKNLFALEAKYEREIRKLGDSHERELRITTEESIEKARSIQAIEYERRLNSLNHAHEQAVAERLTYITKEAYDLAYNNLAKEVTIEREARIRLEATLGTLRGIIIFLGLPGVIALLWTLLAAFRGHTVI